MRRTMMRDVAPESVLPVCLMKGQAVDFSVSRDLLLAVGCMDAVVGKRGAVFLSPLVFVAVTQPPHLIVSLSKAESGANSVLVMYMDQRMRSLLIASIVTCR